MRPHVCPWCRRFRQATPRRFATRGELAWHVDRCGCNPHTWRLDQWVPTFDARLRIAGGTLPRLADPARVDLARLVRDHAIAGTLPATLFDLLEDSA